jgi:hypothetical protein
MDANKTITLAIIAGVLPLLGVIVTAVFSYVIARQNARIQYRQKQEEISRQAAIIRIEKLYEPLINIMARAASYDSFDLSPEDCREIGSIIQNNELYASPDLLQLFWKFKYALSEEHDWSKGLDLYNKAYEEYSFLKEMLGYGSILKKTSRLRSFLRNAYSTIKKKILDLKFKYHRVPKRKKKE